ncbi:MAG TPA: nucleoside recognition domain-containing protein [Symbiobacteriaceae bacterium]|nr:nucleoside recognition domain-containing protein [Symbiobacteriaceae bacterium]
MMNKIWLALLLIGFGAAALTGKVEATTSGALDAAKAAIELTLTLAGVMALWMGIMKIAEQSGLMEGLARLLRPVIGFLFPTVPPDHPAVGAIVMNLSANILGLGAAATPLGLKAMEGLQELNPEKDEASEAMCTFLALNTSSFTLIPGTVIALRAAAGSQSPSSIVGATLVASVGAFGVGITVDWLFRRMARLRR